MQRPRKSSQGSPVTIFLAGYCDFTTATASSKRDSLSSHPQTDLLKASWTRAFTAGAAWDAGCRSIQPLRSKARRPPGRLYLRKESSFGFLRS